MNKQLHQTISTLIESQPNDLRLRDHIEGVVRNEDFPGLTWFWGPALYKRNRAIFRGLILNHFSDWERTSKKWRRIPWSSHAQRLQEWLDVARANRDIQLVRRLLRWKYANAKAWGLDNVAWQAAMLADFLKADSAASRAVVLDEYDDWFDLNESTAVKLYATDRTSSKFILRHLPQAYWIIEKRKQWLQLAALAEQAGDTNFYQELFRRQVPVNVWAAFALNLAKTIKDPIELCDALESHHPSGHGLKLVDTQIRLLELRGRDCIPYIRSKLNEVGGGWFSSGTKPFVTIAEKNEWWDLWAEAVRGDRDPKMFNAAVSKLVTAEPGLSEVERLSRLKALAGVSREWNWSGFGLARIHLLEDPVAVELYQRYPQLVRGPFKSHIGPSYWRDFSKLVSAVRQAEDNELLDFLASRYVTRAAQHFFGQNKTVQKLLDSADSLADYYQAIRDNNELEFANRAANVLTQIPAYAIYGFDNLVASNRLARLLFVRSFESFLDQPAAVQDLVEGSEIHVQMLAYRILAQDDNRARTIAVGCLDILIGTLLRPLHRKTRLAAFGALFNAAQADFASAEQIVGRAREALRLPEKNYPKEQLVGLIGKILAIHPQLRTKREQPVIYGLTDGLMEAAR